VVLFVLNWFVIPWAEGRLWIPAMEINSDKFHAYTGKARVKTEDGHLLYAGKVQDGRITGEGSLYKPNETLVYRGDFLEEAYHGSGKKYHDCGELVKYRGEFAQNRYHGEGTLYQDGEMLYEGEFKNGDMHGEGKLYENDEVVYEGEFEENQYHGEGKLYDGESLIYEGQFQNDLFHGEGDLYHDNSNLKYRGSFAYGEKDGEGKLYHRDGPIIYRGSFSGGHFDGAGEKINPETGRTVYEGQFSQGEYHGFGSLFDDELGRLIYEGEFKEGKYSGEGSLYDRRGRNLYQGHFYQGEIDYYRYVDEFVDVVREDFGDENESHLLDNHFLMEYRQLQTMFALEYQEETLPQIDKIIFTGGQELSGASAGMSLEELPDLFGESHETSSYAITAERQKILDRLNLGAPVDSLYGISFEIDEDIFIRFYSRDAEGQVLYFEMGGV